MRGRDEILGPLPPKAAPPFMEIARGMKLEKCRKCGCMKDALDQAERAFAASEKPEIRSLVHLISGHKAKMSAGAGLRAWLLAHFKSIKTSRQQRLGRRIRESTFWAILRVRSLSVLC